MTTRKSVKTIVKVLLLVLVTILSLIYVLHDDPIRTFSLIGEVAFFPFLLAILLVLVLPFLDALSLTFFTKLYNRRYRFGQGLVNALIGNFIGCIYKTGAIFIQAYTFTKQDVKGAHAASILTMQFLMYQIVFTLFSFVLVFIGYPYVEQIPIAFLGNIKIFPLSLIGLGISLLMLLLIVLLAFCRPLHHFFMNTGIQILGKIHVLKDPENSRRKWTLQLATYRIELKRLAHHLPLVLVSLLTNTAKLVVTFALPYLIFWSIGVPTSSLDFLELFSGMGYLQLISSFIVVGAPEIGFQTIFSYLLSIQGVENSYNVAAAANLLWRVLTFYLPLVLGALFYFFYKGSPRRYELLSNTATIYDLEVLNLHETNDRKTLEFIQGRKAGDGKDAPVLLSKKEVQESFAKIRKNMEKESTYAIPEEDKDKTMTLEIQKKQLARAVAEAEELRKMFRPDPEIEEEVHRDLKESQRQLIHRQAKKRARALRRTRRKMERDKKFLEKMLPKGTKITYDDKKGTDIDGPVIEEERTYTTSDESEREDGLEGGRR